MSDVKPPNLTHKILLCGEIETVTGMHIGGNDAGLAIGGADKLVVRRAGDEQPYVPGSSLKGKMRSLLEKTTCAPAKCEGFVVDRDKLKRGPCDCGTCIVCQVFGVAADTKGEGRSGAARLLVRDAFLSNAKALGRFPGLDFPYTEVKTEVSIDRLTSTANPRQFERVPAGAKFAFEMVLNVFEGDDAEKLLDLVKKGLALVGDDAIGGQGSRGYGQVEIQLRRVAQVPISAYADPVKLAQAREANELATPLRFGGRLPGSTAAA